MFAGVAEPAVDATGACVGASACAVDGTGPGAADGTDAGAVEAGAGAGGAASGGFFLKKLNMECGAAGPAGTWGLRRP